MNKSLKIPQVAHTRLVQKGDHWTWNQRINQRPGSAPGGEGSGPRGCLLLGCLVLGGVLVPGGLLWRDVWSWGVSGPRGVGVCLGVCPSMQWGDTPPFVDKQTPVKT